MQYGSEVVQMWLVVVQGRLALSASALIFVAAYRATREAAI